MATFAERLKVLRTKKGLTQTELGNVVNVAKQTISSYENESSTPDYDTLQRIADYFAVSVDYLLGRTDDPSPPGEKQQAKTEAASRSDDPIKDLPEEAKKDLEELNRVALDFILRKYAKK